MKCPICGKAYLREISPKRYFCAECCHEVSTSRAKMVAYYPDEEGGLRLVGPVEQASKRYQAIHQRKTS